MMTYKETTEYLFNQMPMFERQGATGYKEGLANTRALDEHFNHPHKNYNTIHIGGTNGKGSCSHTLASILQSYGMKVGLYTSPHLLDFRERIRINGECISEEYVVDFVDSERAFFEPLCPSFFEATTAMAFKYFADMKVDIAIIEVGLGGRLDCTNIISPILSIITNISFDHTQFLGNTLEKIAKEKGGIIKEHVPIIIGEHTEETKDVFESLARQKKSPITFAADEQEIVDATITVGGGMKYSTVNVGCFNGELGGIYQAKNTNTVLCAYKKLVECGLISHNPALLHQAFQEVCERTGLMGRWQKVGDKPLIICDTGHNVGGWEYLKQQINNVKCSHKHIVFGMVADKDVDSVLTLLPQDATYYFTQPDTKRAMTAEVLAEKAEKHGLTGTPFNNVCAAFLAARSAASEADFIFVGGSNYLIADFLKTCRIEFIGLSHCVQ